MCEMNHKEIDSWAITGHEPDDVERYLDVLSNRHRRCVLGIIDEENITDREKLARQIAAIDDGQPIEYVSSEVQNQISLELHHKHLPKLDEMGIIEYDPRQGDIRSVDLPDTIVSVLEALKS